MMTIQRRIRLITTLVLVGSMFLTACAGPALTASPTPVPTPTAAPMIPFRIFIPGYTGFGTSEQSGLDAVEAKFQAVRGISLDIQLKSANLNDSVATVNLLLAGGELDAFNLTWDSSVVSDLLSKNLVADLTGSLEREGSNIRKITTQRTLDTVRIQNRYMGIALDPDAHSYVLPYIRKDLLDKLGLPVPKTIDELETVLLAFKKDDPALIPASSSNWWWLLFNVLGGEGLPSKPVETDGRLHPYLITNYSRWYYVSPEFRSYLGRMQRWFQGGLIDPSIFYPDQQAFGEAFYSGRLGFVSMGFWMQGELDRLADLPGAGTRRDFEAHQEWVLIPHLQTSDGRPAVYGVTGVPARYIGVSNSFIDPDIAVAFVDWLATAKENTYLATYGVENEHYRFGDDKRFEALLDETGAKKYSGALGNFAPTFYGLEKLRLTNAWVGTDWEKAFTPDGISTFSFDDEGFVYRYSVDNQDLTRIATRFDETMLAILLDNQPPDTLLALSDELDEMGMEAVLAQRNQQYQEQLKEQNRP
jgi:ABC-type glycerol-3-phosphate transport system substrate-binding protein